MTAPESAESITEAELAGAMAELGIRINGNAYFPELARNIFGYIERQRREPEPVYAVGDLFEDRDGKQWYRVGGGGLPWRHVPTGQHHREDYPARPLRKLVPEGSPISENERDLIHADLGRLLEALGLGDFARPGSPHEVFGMCIDEVIRMTEAGR